MEYPRMLYRVGTGCVLESGTYDLRIVRDAEDHGAATADGWHSDQYAARDAHAAPTHSEPPDDSPPTRAELEQKANELGIKFDGRWGDKRLASAIESALKG